MKNSGNLHRMSTENGSPIQYHLHLEEGALHMNSLLGRKIGITFSGRINCVACGKRIRKAYGQGFCYPCFVNAPEAAPCIFNPERLLTISMPLIS